MLRYRFEGGFCQGIDRTFGSEDASVAAIQTMSWLFRTSMREITALSAN
jgi:hypothetical protein